MNDTTNNEEQIVDADATTATNNRSGNANSQNQAVSSSTPQSHTLEDEEDHVVTSTSSDNIGGTPQRHNTTRNITLQGHITSPACITSSSTGNDYSSSPTQHVPGREETSQILLSSEDDSVEQQHAISTLARKREKNQQQQKDQHQQSNSLNSTLPTTSAAAAATLRSNTKTKNEETVNEITVDRLGSNHLTEERQRQEESASLETDSSINRSNNSNNKNTNGQLVCSNIENLPFAHTIGKMVTREGGGNNILGTEHADNQVEKIILKLPKPTQPVNNNESHNQHQHQHHSRLKDQDQLVDIDPTMSNSCSNSSTNSSVNAEPDTRKVEPLKINLLHGSHHHHHHHHHQSQEHNSSSGSSGSGSGTTSVLNVIPKIIIKPVIKKCDEEAETNTDAKLEEPIPKITIKASNLGTSSSSCSSSDCITSEPHIVPKLTIRAAHEDGGGTLTSVVPKLTIKISDTQSSHNLLNSVLSPTTVKLNATETTTTTTTTTQQPPLPKLTIKTTLDGASGSSILSSSISPALSSSNSSSSAASSPQNAASITSCSSSSVSSAVVSGTTVPKITIKTTMSKNNEDPPTVPKLTIKTSTTTTRSCVSKTSNESTTDEDSVNTNKIPKLTIKTGQEHAVIITQHNNDQTIPKLTIKTKSLDIEASHSDSCEDSAPPEKIPKLTIKATSLETTPSSIPKLTISAPHSPKTHHSAPLVVRQVAATASPTTRKTQSPDRVPKLMISRQETMINHCTIENTTEKVVPKITIKTSNVNEHRSEELLKDKPEKIPKLTIKAVMPPNKSQQSSEESDDALSMDSAPSPEQQQIGLQQTNKLVPKLTIKNLGSPKLKLKSVMEEIIPTPEPKKTVKPCLQPNHDVATESIANGGESSSSQEFCGFTDNNTTESTTLETSNYAKNIVSKPMITDEVDEILDDRRNSDDMDIDEGLQQHDPQIFNNVMHFGGIRNGESYVAHLENNIDELPMDAKSADAVEKDSKIEQMKSQVVDTVDLTSSPSPGSSPAHFNYTDADPKIPELSQLSTQPGYVSNALLMECLQRETSVIQTPARSKTNNNSLLLSQLTAPLRHPPPPPLHPRPPPHLLNTSQSSLRYPQLTERLLANGAHQSMLPASQHQQQQPSPPIRNLENPLKPQANVIDSIEILDTPEGSPRSLQDDSQSAADFNMLDNSTQQVYASERSRNRNLNTTVTSELLRHNNNIMINADSEIVNHHSGVSFKRQAKEFLLNNKNDCYGVLPNKIHRSETLASTMATLTILTNDNATNSATVITTSPTLISNAGEHNCTESPKSETIACTKTANATTPQHRSRKQKHENLLTLPNDEIETVNAAFSNNDAAISENTCTQNNEPAASKSNQLMSSTSSAINAISSTPPQPQKKRGRPKKQKLEVSVEELKIQRTIDGGSQNTPNASTHNSATSVTVTAAAERRVQLLRKRLAIDMVAAEQPSTPLEGILENVDAVSSLEEVNTETPRRERAVRTTRRCGTPNTSSEKLSGSSTKQRKHRNSMVNASNAYDNIVAPTSAFNNFGGSNSSLSSACSSSSSYATTMTTAASVSNATNVSGVLSTNLMNCNYSMSSQLNVDLTMSSSSSSGSQGSTTVTMAGNCTSGLRVNSMLPPIKALSSTDPLPDVVFREQDFSSIMLTQQLNSSSPSSRMSSRQNSQDDCDLNNSIGSGSGDDALFTGSPMRTPTPGRGRGRGRGRGSRGAHKAHRLGRGASAVAKQIALSRPRCVGVLKHTPDPGRLKVLFKDCPSPQVFEEDTRMSADMSQSQMNSEPYTPTKPSEFLITEEESQSSIISSTSLSILNPNSVAAVQSGANIKRPKKKKMEVCAADETEYLVSSIAEYDWPPPKGCCPSKNRDTFMIQEQVANYLGIKSFKRKYPDLPRRQIDMEERNWLQEKGLVSEKMCDLGITAVWASDILDIMYADFYDKYEEYKDFMRQKHLREIETKQKALGLNVGGRGLQARDRAMLSASKWNAYFNKTRKDERTSCLDMQTLIVNVPLPSTMPASTLVNRSLAEDISKAASAEQIADPPTLLQPRQLTRTFDPATYYPVSLVPGQYSQYYKQYTPQELCAYPLNTVLKVGKDLDAITSTAEETDSANETVFEIVKRYKVLHSRRVRSERSSKQNCDIKSEHTGDTHPQIPNIVNKNDSDTESNTEKGSSMSSSSSSSSTSSSSSCSSSESESCCTLSEDDNGLRKRSRCNVCQRTQHRNMKDLPELFVKCYTCRRKVHPSCIEMPHRMAQRVRNYNWQCAECKCCMKCKRKQESNKMLYCEQCDRGFHIYCLGIKTIPDGRWSCERCCACMRCGATKPDGLPQQINGGEKTKQVKHKKVKWINEYRIDHITKLREHCSMLCVPCGRNRPAVKRVQTVSSPTVNNANIANRNNVSVHGNTNNAAVQNKKLQMSPPVVPVSNSNFVAFTANGGAPNNIITTNTTITTIATTTHTTTNSPSIPPSKPPVVA